jgi:hypothetical protein
MHPRLTLVILGLIVLSILGAGVYILLQPKQTPPEKQPVTLPTSGTSVTPTPSSFATSSSSLLVLTAVDGAKIETRNFLDDPDTWADPVNEGYYQLGFSNATDPEFIVTYIESTQYFNIALLKEPLGEVRKHAEQFFLQRLGVSTRDACRLAYTISTNSRVSTLYGGTSLGFSFCPGATKLPE